MAGGVKFTRHENVQDNFKTAFQDDQEIVIRDISTKDDSVDKWALQTQTGIV